VNPELQASLAAIQALAALIGAVLAGLAYWKGRQNHIAIAESAVKVAEVTAKVSETHDLVNSNSDLLRNTTAAVAEATGYRQGVIDQAGGAPRPGPFPPKDT
jgi:hypothetical protein